MTMNPSRSPGEKTSMLLPRLEDRHELHEHGKVS